MDDLEVKAEVFRIIRANSDCRNASLVYRKIKEHLGDKATDDQIKDAIKYLLDKS